jgi:hypothetical protein
MNKLFSIVLLVLGIVIFGYGLKASDSIGSGFSRLFTGAPSDNTIWLLVGGGLAIAIGAGGLFRGSKAL